MDSAPALWSFHLYQRPSPDFAGHDFRGFRNTGILRRADVVAMGDSQTYGMGSPLQQAWPQQLEFCSNQSVYNMSWGGWGPIQYGFLWEEALSLQPHTVVVGFHTPDFLDCYVSVYRRGLSRRFKTVQADPLAWLVEKGILPSVEERIAAIFAEDAEADAVQATQAVDSPTPYEPLSPRPALVPVPYRWHTPKLLRLPSAADAFLFDHWRPYYRWQYRRTGNVRERLPPPMAGEPAPPDQDVLVIQEPLRDFFVNFTTSDLEWMMLIPTRSRAVDLTSPYVAEGFRVAVELFKDLQHRAEEAGVRLVVALLPTKELAFSSFLDTHYEGELPPGYANLVASESLIRHLLIRTLRDHGTETVDTLPGLEACFTREELPYPLRQDGHPNAIGYREIARQIRDALARPPEENLELAAVDWDRLLHSVTFARGPALPARIQVKARLIQRSTRPTVASIFPYQDAQVTHLYQVVETVQGEDPGDEILVAHWAIRNNKALPQHRERDRVYELTLEPFARHVRLAREFMVDETTATDAAYFYDVDSDPENRPAVP